jgi:GDPmannose 4,6-dehydratase
LFLHYADLEDTTALRGILQRVQPDELYHLAGQSHVGLSFEIPETTCEITGRDLPRIPKLLHASSSEIFGQPTTMPQTEESPVNPASPYAQNRNVPKMLSLPSPLPIRGSAPGC